MQWDKYANKSVDMFTHIGDKGYTELHGGAVYPVTVIEDSEGPYWGWRDSTHSRDSVPIMIWKGKTLFGMCFTYGYEVEVERGKGKVVRLRVESRVEGAK